MSDVLSKIGRLGFRSDTRKDGMFDSDDMEQALNTIDVLEEAIGEIEYRLFELESEEASEVVDDVINEFSIREITESK